MGTGLCLSVVLLALVTGAWSASASGIGDAPAPARQPSVTTDVVYGHKNGLALTLDVHRPAQPNGAGVISVVSGGWQSSTTASVRHRRARSARGRFGVDRRHQDSIVSLADTMTGPPDLLPGTLDLLILRTLQKDALHGWAISERIQEISEDVLQINQGSLYPALHRLEHRGWIDAEWAVSELGRRAKYYRLTTAGRKQLAVETREWERMSNAIGRVMKLA